MVTAALQEDIEFVTVPYKQGDIIQYCFKPGKARNEWKVKAKIREIIECSLYCVVKVRRCSGLQIDYLYFYADDRIYCYTSRNASSRDGKVHKIKTIEKIDG